LLVGEDIFSLAGVAVFAGKVTGFERRDIKTS